MNVVTAVTAIVLIFAGVGGVVYSAARATGWAHRRAALAAYFSIPFTFVGILAQTGQPELATGAGYLLGGVALTGVAVWLWLRRPLAPAVTAQPTAPTGSMWAPAQEVKVEQLRTGMGRKAEWVVEEL